jgi:hypothetical protein
MWGSELSRPTATYSAYWALFLLLRTGQGAVSGLADASNRALRSAISF